MRATLFSSYSMHSSTSATMSRVRVTPSGHDRLKSATKALNRIRGSVKLRLVFELIDGVMHALLHLAPEAPGLFTFKYFDRPRQVVGRIPMIEFIAQRSGNHGANEQEGFWIAHTGKLSCFRAGISTCLLRSIASARAMRRRVE